MACVLLSCIGMDCWIGVADEGGQRLVRLAGRLSTAQVPSLLEACSVPGALEIDLSDLISADAAGIEALQRVRLSGARLRGVPGYIQLKLDTACQPQPPLPTRRPKRP
jgi:hypothetical protein